MIKAIALDDEPPALKVLENFCGRADLIDLVKTFTNPREAARFMTKFPVDLLFLDIRMPSISGLEFYKMVPQDTIVIFTTAHREYAVEGFNLSALDYLLKPFTFERFMQAVNKSVDFYRFYHQKEDAAQQYIFVRADYSLVKIMLNEILYIEGLDDYLKVHFPSKKPVVTRMTMKSIMEKLPEKEFIRVHRSFIIPLSKIEKVRNKMISIGGISIPVGSSYEKAFNDIYTDQ